MEDGCEIYRERMQEIWRVIKRFTDKVYDQENVYVYSVHLSVRTFPLF